MEKYDFPHLRAKKHFFYKYPNCYSISIAPTNTKYYYQSLTLQNFIKFINTKHYNPTDNILNMLNTNQLMTL